MNTKGRPNATIVVMRVSRASQIPRVWRGFLYALLFSRVVLTRLKSLSNEQMSNARELSVGLLLKPVLGLNVETRKCQSSLRETPSASGVTVCHRGVADRSANVSRAEAE